MAIWKRHEEAERATPAAPPTPPLVAAPTVVERVAAEETRLPAPPPRQELGAYLGRSLQFRGEISGSEDLTIDGAVQGTIRLGAQQLILGPNAEVQADVAARDVIVHGRLKGNVDAQDRVEIVRTGKIVGDLTMGRIVMQDGAYFKGNVRVRAAESAKPLPAPATLPLTPAIPAAAPLSVAAPDKPISAEKSEEPSAPATPPPGSRLNVRV